MSNVVAFTGSSIRKEPRSSAADAPFTTASKLDSAARLWWRRVRLFMEAIGWLIVALAVAVAVA